VSSFSPYYSCVAWLVVQQRLIVCPVMSFLWQHCYLN